MTRLEHRCLNKNVRSSVSMSECWHSGLLNTLGSLICSVLLSFAPCLFSNGLHKMVLLDQFLKLAGLNKKHIDLTND